MGQLFPDLPLAMCQEGTGSESTERSALTDNFSPTGARLIWSRCWSSRRCDVHANRSLAISGSLLSLCLRCVRPQLLQQQHIDVLTLSQRHRGRHERFMADVLLP